MAAEIADSIAFGYRGTRHLLAVCGEGLRREGVPFVEGLRRSSLRISVERSNSRWAFCHIDMTTTDKSSAPMRLRRSSRRAQSRAPLRAMQR
jgi:hypothetical protein